MVGFWKAAGLLIIYSFYKVGRKAVGIREAALYLYGWFFEGFWSGEQEYSLFQIN